MEEPVPQWFQFGKRLKRFIEEKKASSNPPFQIAPKTVGSYVVTMKELVNIADPRLLMELFNVELYKPEEYFGYFYVPGVAAQVFLKSDENTPEELGSDVGGKCGGVGRVKKVEWKYRTGSRDIAVKELTQDKDLVIQNKRSAIFSHEENVLRNLDHPNVIQYFGCFNKGTTFQLFLEWGVNDLDFVVCTQKQQYKAEWLINIADGLIYLHGREKPRLHLDIKPKNLILMQSGVVKLGDFGSSIEQGENPAMSIFTAPPYTPPEGYEAIYTPAFDVFSFGVTLWALSRQERPYDDVDSKEWKTGIRDVTLCGKRPTLLGMPSDSELLIPLIERCWAQRREDRPTMPEVKLEVEKLFTIKR